MEYEQENSSDMLNPKMIREQLKAHDKRMRDGREGFALAKACYTTSYWDYIQGAKVATETSKLTDVNVEVNRLWGVLTSYLGALYPRANRVVVGPDPTGVGDAPKAEVAANRWLSSSKIHHRVMSGLRQALLYPGCAAKVGFYPGHGNPLDRVWLRIIPWWETVLDCDVGDAEDERFRAHVYYRPKSEVEQEYNLENLAGTSRTDFLAVDNTSDQYAQGKKGRKSKQAETDEGAFVRVLEVCNLKDTVKDSEDPDIVYQGRLEIYILGQGREYDKPVYIGPMPFASTDGQPLAHIVPLIFNHEPEFPLKGIAHSARILPQIVELNAYRSFMAMATRKDTRQFVTRKGTFNSDDLTNLTEGHDGLVIEVANDYEGPLDDAIRPISNAPLSGNISNYLATVENDLERGIGASPQARGIITKATAFEVQTVQQYTESDFGMHAAIKDDWLGNIVKLVMRAIISSMHDRGDSAGAYDTQDVEIAEVGAIAETADSNVEEENKQLSESDLAEDAGQPSTYVDEDAFDELGKTEQEPGKRTLEAQTLTLRDRSDDIVVTIEDLDADFVISFVEGGRTPLTDSAMQQNLVSLLPTYTELWGAVQKKGPMGTLARSYMQVLAERFDLPKDLHPDELEASMVEDSEESKSSGDSEPSGEEQMLQQEMQQPAQPAPTEPQGAPQQSMGQILQQIQQMPIPEQIQALKALFQDDPAVLQAIEQLEQLPPDRQQQAIAQMLGGENAPV